jgi:predicted nucleic acid-binding protein
MMNASAAEVLGHSSEMATIEIDAMPDSKRRREVRLSLPSESSILKLTAAIWDRVKRLTELGFKPADAAHVAAAESGGADIFFTCDDRLLKAARRNRMLLAVRVSNPLDWLREDRNGAHA